jgi:hypothetical protein
MLPKLFLTLVAPTVLLVSCCLSGLSDGFHFEPLPGQPIPAPWLHMCLDPPADDRTYFLGKIVWDVVGPRMAPFS